MIFDDFDTTPIAWSDGKTVTVYDPIGQRLLLGATTGVAVRMLQLGDQGTLDIIVSETPEDQDERLAEQGGPFPFDLRSIVEADRRERKDAERASDGSIRTRILAPSGQQLDVTIDRGGLNALDRPIRPQGGWLRRFSLGPGERSPRGSAVRAVADASRDRRASRRRTG